MNTPSTEKQGECMQEWSIEIPTSPRMEPASTTPRRLLLISDIPRGAATFSRALRALQLESSWTRLGSEGLTFLRRRSVDLLLIDTELPDMSGLDVLRRVREEHETLRCLVLSDHVTASLADYARSLGALGVVGKPYTTADVIGFVTTALHPRTTARIEDDAPASRLLSTNGGESARAVFHDTSTGTGQSGATRWAALVLSTIDAEEDPKTILNWARFVGVSRSVLSERCRVVHIPTHVARDFARLVRAICRSSDVWQPEAVLDLADSRTVKRLLRPAGLAEPRSAPPSLRDFLAHQDWIPQENSGLIALREWLFGSHGRPALARPDA